MHTFIYNFNLEPITKEIQISKENDKNITLATSFELSHPFFVELDNFIRTIYILSNNYCGAEI